MHSSQAFGVLRVPSVRPAPDRYKPLAGTVQLPESIQIGGIVEVGRLGRHSTRSSPATPPAAYRSSRLTGASATGAVGPTTWWATGPDADAPERPTSRSSRRRSSSNSTQPSGVAFLIGLLTGGACFLAIPIARSARRLAWKRSSARCSRPALCRSLAKSLEIRFAARKEVFALADRRGPIGLARVAAVHRRLHRSARG